MSVIANPLFINYSIAPNENKVSEKSILCVEDLIGPFIGDFHAPDRFLRAIFPILLISLHFAATLRFRIARERLPMPIYTRSLHSMKVVIQWRIKSASPSVRCSRCVAVNTLFDSHSSAFFYVLRFCVFFFSVVVFHSPPDTINIGFSSTAFIIVQCSPISISIIIVISVTKCNGIYLLYHKFKFHFLCKTFRWTCGACLVVRCIEPLGHRMKYE